MKSKTERTYMKRQKRPLGAPPALGAPYGEMTKSPSDLKPGEFMEIFLESIRGLNPNEDWERGVRSALRTAKRAAKGLTYEYASGAEDVIEAIAKLLKRRRAKT